jgi:hypothetical protein
LKIKKYRNIGITNIILIFLFITNFIIIATTRSSDAIESTFLNIMIALLLLLIIWTGITTISMFKSYLDIKINEANYEDNTVSLENYTNQKRQFKKVTIFNLASSILGMVTIIMFFILVFIAMQAK